MKKNINKLFLAAILLIMVALIFGIIYFFMKPGTHRESKNISIEVIDDCGQYTNYEVSTNAEFLSEVFDEVEDLTVEGDSSEYGLYITTVNGLKADYNTDQAYWSILVNSEYGQFGADAQPVADGDSFSLVYTKDSQ